MNLERYIDKYIPISAQTQISETLQACLPRKYLNRLDLYETERFNELNAAVLDEFSDNQEKVERMKSEALEYMAKQKAKESLDGGGSIIGVTDMSFNSGGGGKKRKTLKEVKESVGRKQEGAESDSSNEENSRKKKKKSKDS